MKLSEALKKAISPVLATLFGVTLLVPEAEPAKEFVKELLKNTGGGFHYWQLVAIPVATVISHIFTHISAESTVELYNDVTARFRKAPYQLNHDLQHLFMDAIVATLKEGLENDYEHYKKQYGLKMPLTKPTIDQLEILANEFEEALRKPRGSDENRNDKSIDTSEFITLLLEKNATQYHGLFTNKGRISDKYYPTKLFKGQKDFLKYFNLHFIPLVQLFVTENLKNKHYYKAKVAFEKMMAEETYRSLQEIKRDLKRPSDSKAVNQVHHNLLQKDQIVFAIDQLQSSEALIEPIKEGLGSYFERFEKKLDEIIQQGKRHEELISDNLAETKTIKTTAKKSQNALYIVVIMLAIVIGGITYLIRNINNHRISNNENITPAKTAGTLKLPVVDNGKKVAAQGNKPVKQPTNYEKTIPVHAVCDDGEFLMNENNWIKVTRINNNALQFSGRISERNLAGFASWEKMFWKISLPNASVKGSLSFSSDCKKLTASLAIEQSNQEIPFDLYRK